MKLTYDPRHNIAYLRLHAKAEQVDTIRVSEELNVDIGPDGTVYGIELLNANAQLTGEDHGKLVVLNAEQDTTQEILLKPAPALVREPPSPPYGEKEPQP